MRKQYLLLTFFITILTIPGFCGTDSSRSPGPRLFDSSDIYVQEIILSKVPVLIDFWAEWCAPCRVLSPLIKQLKSKYNGKIKVIKINIDRNQKLAHHFKVRSIPAIYMVENKIVTNSVLGVQPKRVYVNMIEEILNPEPDNPDSTVQ